MIQTPVIETPSERTGWEVEEQEYYDNVQSVFVSGSYAYVAGDEWCTVVDISNPANPQEVGRYGDIPAQDIFVSGSYAYVAVGRDDGLWVVDVSDPTEFRKVSRPLLSLLREAVSSVFVSGSYAYVLTSGSLIVMDLSDPVHPYMEARCKIERRPKDVFVSGTYAYVADGSGLAIIDVSDPAKSHMVGYYDTPGRATGIYVSGTYAYVADDDAGLRVLDVSNHANPTEVGFYDTPGRARHVVVDGPYAYVADGGGGLTILRFTGSR